MFGCNSAASAAATTTPTPTISPATARAAARLRRWRIAPAITTAAAGLRFGTRLGPGWRCGSGLGPRLGARLGYGLRPRLRAARTAVPVVVPRPAVAARRAVILTRRTRRASLHLLGPCVRSARFLGPVDRPPGRGVRAAGRPYLGRQVVPAADVPAVGDEASALLRFAGASGLDVRLLEPALLDPASW
jgi:hypothetical protein